MLFSEETLHDPNTVEWWFFQGHYQGKDAITHFFMTSFFRIGSRRQEGSGHILITADLADSPDGYFHSCSSQIDQKIVDYFFAEKKDIEPYLDSNLIKAYFEEIAEFGPLESIALESQPVVIDFDKESIAWKTFSLQQECDSLHLHYDNPQGLPCRFTLKSTIPSITVGGRWSSADSGKTVLQTSPRMDLVGTVGESEVRGRAWFDHQWSDYNFFYSDGETNITYGWDWLGISLNDGRDLIIYIYKDMVNQRIVARNAYLMTPDHAYHHYTDFEIHCSRYWQSPKTHIVYPAIMVVNIPEISLALTIEPLAADQEIPFWGLTRAIWEGACRVRGASLGKQVEGFARMECYGYGYVFDTKSFLQSFSRRIDHHIEDFLPKTLTDSWMEKTLGKAGWRYDPEGCTKAIAEPVWDLLSRNGKHWRPICAMLFLETLGVDSTSYEQICAAVSELNHTGSLIIDDIEDNSTVRRGRQCIHLKYGIDTAINAGNSLYFLPYLLIKDHPGFDDAQRLRAYELMVHTLSKCHFGQGLDIFWSKQLTRTFLENMLEDCFDQKILEMYSHKTGAQVEGVARMSCIIAEASDLHLQAYGDLGRIFGVAFQIVDDIHNFSTSSGWTKMRGEDIAAGKPTYVIVRALELLDSADRQKFLDIFCSQERRTKKGYLQEAVDIIEHSGALQLCHEQAERMLQDQWHIFTGLSRHNDAKILLKMFLFSILNYSYDV